MSLELEWEEHWGGWRDCTSSDVPEDFADFPTLLHEFGTPLVNQGPSAEYSNVEAIQAGEPSSENIPNDARTSEDLSIDEWLLPGTDARIRISAPPEGLGALEPSGTTHAYAVARALHLLCERLRRAFRSAPTADRRRPPARR